MKSILHTDDKIRVVVDTNLWISSLIGRRLAGLRKFFENSTFELVSTTALVEEISVVALRDKFRKYFEVCEAMELLSWMQENTLSVEIEGNIPVRCRDPKDDYLLELAVQAKAIYLVSGDSDLLELENIGDCRIMTVAQFEAEWFKLSE